ncbi:MAG: hypothetical protein DRI52_04200 [Chloroflexi bacterium]|nr:MAG: hypothetical protein DRI52_04200 [Chloroflexota bacterium]
MLFIVLLILSFPLSYKQAVNYLAEGEFKKADSLFKVAIFEAEESEKNDIFLHLELLIEYGEHPDILINYGKIENAILNQEYDKAIDEWENTPKNFRQSRPGLYLKALLLEAKEDHLNSAKVFEQIGKQKGPVFSAISLLKAALIYNKKLKNTEKGKQLLIELITKYPQSPYADIARGYLEEEVKTENSN